jgi:hypothetical protein
MPRKKWGFRLNEEEDIRQGFGSERAVYAAVHEEAENFVAGSVRVYVDERDGAGWTLYEELDLADLAEGRPSKESLWT